MHVNILHYSNVLEEYKKSTPAMNHVSVVIAGPNDKLDPRGDYEVIKSKNFSLWILYPNNEGYVVVGDFCTIYGITDFRQHTYRLQGRQPLLTMANSDVYATISSFLKAFYESTDAGRKPTT